MEFTFRPEITIDFPEHHIQMDDESKKELETVLGNIIEKETKNAIRKKIVKEIDKIIEYNWEDMIMHKIKDWVDTEKGTQFVEDITRMVLRQRVKQMVNGQHKRRAFSVRLMYLLYGGLD